MRTCGDSEGCPPFLIRCLGWDFITPSFRYQDRYHYVCALVMDPVVQDTPGDTREMAQYLRATLQVPTERGGAWPGAWEPCVRPHTTHLRMASFPISLGSAQVACVGFHPPRRQAR